MNASDLPEDSIGKCESSGLRRVLVVSAVSLAGFLACCGGCLWLLSPPYRALGTFQFVDGVTIVVWSEGDWDPDHFHPGVYYKAELRGVEVVPKSHLGSDMGEPFEFATASVGTGRDSILCVYEVNEVHHGQMIIVYDAKSKKSWPRDQDSWYLDPVVHQFWRQRFERLKREYPDLDPRHILDYPN